MSYLIPSDYRKQIQDINLQQVIGSDNTVLLSAQLAAQAEAISYLKQRFIVAQEFTDTNQWNYLVAYMVGQRVYLDAPIYVTTTSYTIGVYVTYNGIVYKCNTATTGAFDITKWQAVAPQFSIFSAAYPQPLFQYNSYYNVGDMVYWNGRTYTCRIQTPLLDHDTLLQYQRIESLPLQNVTPDDAQQGIVYWGVGLAYNIPALTDITNSAWILSDNRDQQMVMYLVDICLYHIHSRISPKNIPDLRVKRYDDAISWLKMCAESKITPALPVIQPRTGSRIRFGGNVKQINSF